MHTYARIFAGVCKIVAALDADDPGRNKKRKTAGDSNAPAIMLGDRYAGFIGGTRKTAAPR